jgi:hypothetical protein
MRPLSLSLSAESATFRVRSQVQKNLFRAKLSTTRGSLSFVSDRRRRAFSRQHPEMCELSMMNATHADSPHVLFVALFRGDSFGDALRRSALHLSARGKDQALPCFHALVNKVVSTVPTWISQHTLSQMPPDAVEQHRNLSRGKPTGAGIFLWKLFLYRLIPVRKLIVLDVDVVLVSSAKIHGLWMHFETFSARHVIGIVPEQGPTYAGLGASVSGYNGGVQLHHLERMRNHADWAPGASSNVTAGLRMPPADSSNTTSSGSKATFDSFVRHCASAGCRGWDKVEPSLGDQTFYTHVCHAAPHLCRQLPCGWNRQLSTRFYRAHDFAVKWHACAGRCKLLHFNQPLLEGIVPDLQHPNRQPSCAECRRALSDLENRTRASGSRNPKFTWGDSKAYMARQIEACCCPLQTSDGDSRDGNGTRTARKGAD